MKGLEGQKEGPVPRDWAFRAAVGVLLLAATRSWHAPAGEEPA